MTFSTYEGDFYTMLPLARGHNNQQGISGHGYSSPARLPSDPARPHFDYQTTEGGK